jgi:hypothetical protein
MVSATNFLIVVLGTCSITIGAFVFRKRKLFVLLVSLGILMLAYPFVRHHVLTRDAYEWTIIVHRELGDSQEHKPIFIDSIEWITDYEKLKKQRRSVGSFMLNKDKTGKEWKAKGYIPVAISADVLYGRIDFKITRNLAEMDPGRYTFTLTFDENDVGIWAVSQNAVAGGSLPE